MVAAEAQAASAVEAAVSAERDEAAVRLEAAMAEARAQAETSRQAAIAAAEAHWASTVEAAVAEENEDAAVGFEAVIAESHICRKVVPMMAPSFDEERANEHLSPALVYGQVEMEALRLSSHEEKEFPRQAVVQHLPKEMARCTAMVTDICSLVEVRCSIAR